jgi:hypothetical protein
VIVVIVSQAHMHHWQVREGLQLCLSRTDGLVVVDNDGASQNFELRNVRAP